MEHAKNLLLKVTLASGAQCTGKEVATSSVLSRAPPAGQVHHVKEGRAEYCC